MKIRTSFVSNSSSSSFVCDVSGTCLTGYNDEYEEPISRCECGHEFLAEYLLPAKRDLTTQGKRMDSEQESSERCPLCQFKEISWENLAKYIMKK